MIPSECGCSRLAVEAAKVVPGWLLNTASPVKSTEDRLSIRTSSGPRASASAIIGKRQRVPLRRDCKRVPRRVGQLPSPFRPCPAARTGAVHCAMRECHLCKQGSAPAPRPRLRDGRQVLSDHPLASAGSPEVVPGVSDHDRLRRRDQRGINRRSEVGVPLRTTYLAEMAR